MIMEPREYQQKIFETAKDFNTLVVLPTGTGKTLIAFLLAKHRLELFPSSKILFLAPTKPLVEQHYDYFKENLPELYAELQMFTGKIDSKKREKIWPLSDIIFATPQCVDGQTLIFTEEGPISISEFFKKFKFREEKYGEKNGKVADISKKVLGYKNKEICLLNATKAWILPANKLIKIKTKLGNSLTCTPEHPLLTITSEGELAWKNAEKLCVGDYIASAKKIYIKEKESSLLNFFIEEKSLKISDKDLIRKLLLKIKEKRNELNIKFGKYARFNYNFMPLKEFLELAKKIGMSVKKISVTDWQGKSSPLILPPRLDRSLGYVLGAMLGDGHIGNRTGHGGEVVFSELDRESIKNEFKKTIEEIFGIHMKEEKQKGLVSYNSALATVLSALGIPKGNKARKIRVPKLIFFSSEEVIKGFIKGIFDTDGSASKYGVSISSVSKEFIEDIKWLFLRLGIIGNMEKRKNFGIIRNRKLKEAIIYTFRFSGRRNLEKFLEVSPNEEKCTKLLETLRKTKRPYTRAKEIIPIKELMKKICKQNIKKEKYYKFFCLSFDNLKEISNKFSGKEVERLRSILDLPIRWVKIKDIKQENDSSIVYDLTIEGEHNFITNNLISHNTVANDLKKNKIDLKEVSLLIEDECHRCTKNYDYTYIARRYLETSKNPRIIGMTASPGSDQKTIMEICKCLDIEKIESRDRESDDVKPYLQELEIRTIAVEFPKEFDVIRTMLEEMYDKKIDELKNRSLLFGPASKKNLLLLQHKLGRQASSGNSHFNVLKGLSVCAQAIKLSHALELIETQGLTPLKRYFQNLFEQANNNQSNAVKQIVKNPLFGKAYAEVIKLDGKMEHPKFDRLGEIMQGEISKNPDARFIVFSQYRDMASLISQMLNKIGGIKSRLFIGQLKKNDLGLSQKEQKQILAMFREGEINCLTATSIGEEGLDLPEVNAVIFYEPVPSAIRKIQRQGRTARLKPGKLMMLMTKNTRDEAYYWTAHHKEKRMKRIISDMQKDFEKESQSSLESFK